MFGLTLDDFAPQVEEILFLELPERFARALMRLAQSHGERTPAGIRITLPADVERPGSAVVPGSSERLSRSLRVRIGSGMNKPQYPWETTGLCPSTMQTGGESSGSHTGALSSSRRRWDAPSSRAAASG
mgnify:CR=1 FL=1